MDEVKEKLNDVISNELEGLNDYNAGEDKAVRIDNICKLYRLRIEEEKAEQDRKDKERKVLNDFLTLEDRKFDRYFNIGATLITTGLSFLSYRALMKKGFQFEEQGTYTSDTFKFLRSRIKPTKMD